MPAAKRKRKTGRPRTKLLTIDDFIIPEPKKIADKDGNPPPIQMEIENLREQIRFAAHCAGCNFTLREIAEAVAKEFNISEPGLSTISGWLKEYREAYEQDCKELVGQRRVNQGHIVDCLLKKWLPVALANKYAVMRTKVIDGETLQVLDEDAYDEQSKAAAIVIKLLERDAKLWGIDLAKVDEKTGNTVTADTINYYISQQVAAASGPRGGAIDIESDPPRKVLELHAGPADIDAL